MKIPFEGSSKDFPEVVKVIDDLGWAVSFQVKER